VTITVLVDGATGTAAGRTGARRGWVSRAIRCWRTAGGGEVMETGLPPGPAVGGRWLP
jgi:hypothetical protein